MEYNRNDLERWLPYKLPSNQPTPNSVAVGAAHSSKKPTSVQAGGPSLPFAHLHRQTPEGESLKRGHPVFPEPLTSKSQALLPPQIPGDLLRKCLPHR